MPTTKRRQNTATSSKGRPYVRRAHPMRIREGEVATGGIGTGFVPIDTERLSELDKSRQRLERDESMKILSDRIAKENFNRRLRETEAKAKRRAFDKKTAPTWSEEFE